MTVADPTSEQPEDPPPIEEEPATLPELNACKKHDRVAKKNRRDSFKPTPRIITAETKIVGGTDRRDRRMALGGCTRV